MTTFSDLELNEEILLAINELGYESPTLSTTSYPSRACRKRPLASAQTGTGKTAGFTLPILQKLITTPRAGKDRKPIRALILTPTRELAAQVAENVKNIAVTCVFVLLSSLVG